LKSLNLGLRVFFRDGSGALVVDRALGRDPAGACPGRMGRV